MRAHGTVGLKDVGDFTEATELGAVEGVYVCAFECDGEEAIGFSAGDAAFEKTGEGFHLDAGGPLDVLPLLEVFGHDCGGEFAAFVGEITKLEESGGGEGGDDGTFAGFEEGLGENNSSG